MSTIYQVTAPQEERVIEAHHGGLRYAVVGLISKKVFAVFQNEYDAKTYLSSRGSSYNYEVVDLGE